MGDKEGRMAVGLATACRSSRSLIGKQYPYTDRRKNPYEWQRTGEYRKRVYVGIERRRSFTWIREQKKKERETRVRYQRCTGSTVHDGHLKYLKFFLPHHKHAVVADQSCTITTRSDDVFNTVQNAIRTRENTQNLSAITAYPYLDLNTTNESKIIIAQSEEIEVRKRR